MWKLSIIVPSVLLLVVISVIYLNYNFVLYFMFFRENINFHYSYEAESSAITD